MIAAIGARSVTACIAVLLVVSAGLTTALAAEASGPFGLSSLEFAFTEALALIALACLFIPISKRLGLGTVIGYLVAGIVAGTVVRLSYADDPETLLHFAEFGVVLFLFVIGLEFRPQRLWELRSTIFGRGLAQVAVTGIFLGLVAFVFGLDWRASLIIGAGLALSSTALVMREIDEGGERDTPFGITALAVLLFEDLAIVPLLLLVTLIAPSGAEMSFASNMIAVLSGIAAIVFLVLVSRYLLDPMFTIIARTRTPELMTAAALGVVIFASLIMTLAGLSYAMGAFIAGMMLADSSFRHEVEADIEPFRALFLGLFFMAVGLSLDLVVVLQNLWLILVAVPVLIVLKGIGIYAVSRLFGSGHKLSLRIAFAMGQHGEFGFVLFAAAGSALILDSETTAIVISIVTLSMALSSQSDRLFRLVSKDEVKETIEEDFSDADGDVLIIGFGRVGQMVAQPLIVQGASVTLLDHDADRIREAKRFGSRVHFGDGTRREVLHAAGADHANVIVIATDDPKITLAITKLVRRSFPNAKVLVRAFDRIQAVQLENTGADIVIRETFAAGLELGGEALQALGRSKKEANAAIASTRKKDEQRLTEQKAAAIGQSEREDIVNAIVPEPLAKL